MPDREAVAENGGEPRSEPSSRADHEIADGGGSDTFENVPGHHGGSGTSPHRPEDVARSRIPAPDRVDVDTEHARHENTEVDAPEEISDDGDDDC